MMLQNGYIRAQGLDVARAQCEARHKHIRLQDGVKIAEEKEKEMDDSVWKTLD